MGKNPHGSIVQMETSLICVIVVILMWQMMSAPLTERGMSRTTRRRMKKTSRQVGMGSLDGKKLASKRGQGSMTPKVGKVTCKVCNKVFESGEAWRDNTTCDRPDDCSCPEVKLSMSKATAAINKAKGSAGYRVRQTEEFIPTGRDVSEHQVYTSVAPILSLQISKNRSRRGKSV